MVLEAIGTTRRGRWTAAITVLQQQDVVRRRRRLTINRRDQSAMHRLHPK